MKGWMKVSAKVLNGLTLSKKIKQNVAAEVSKLKEAGIQPGLAVVIVEGDAASRVYVNAKKKDCEECGIQSFEYTLPHDVSQNDLLTLIDVLNKDENVHGILCQLPLPEHIDENKIIDAIHPEKDADCFHPYNVGLLTTGHPKFMPCTPAGIVELLKEEQVDLGGKECVVIGRSNIVGKPMALLLLSLNGTVTVCHSKTKDIALVCKKADVLVSAIGKAKFVKADMVKPGAIVIDVGVSRTEDGKLVGDVDFENVSPIASAITKVTGGVGPMTRAMLMVNTLTAAKMNIKM